MNKFDENKTSNFGDAEFLVIIMRTMKVPVKTLDQIYYDKTQENFSVKLIKCDTQGQELNIIIGAKKIIDKYKPYLYVENDDVHTSKNLMKKSKVWDMSCFGINHVIQSNNF